MTLNISLRVHSARGVKCLISVFEVVEAGHPVGRFLAVDFALAFGMQYGIVALCHMVPVGKFGKRRVLPLADMVELIRIAVCVARRVSLTHEVGIVPVLTVVVIGKLVFQPILSAVEGTSVDSGIRQGLASVDGFLYKTRLHVDSGLRFRAYGLEDNVRPSGQFLKFCEIMGQRRSSVAGANQNIRLTFREVKSARDAIRTKEEEVLNYFIDRSTNASAESLNSKLKGFRSQPHGVSDLPLFMYRVSRIFG